MYTIILPYRWKYWRGIKFGGLAVHAKTAKLNFANIFFHAQYLNDVTLVSYLAPPISRSQRIVSSNHDDGAVEVLERKGVHI